MTVHCSDLLVVLLVFAVAVGVPSLAAILVRTLFNVIPETSWQIHEYTSYYLLLIMHNFPFYR